MISLVSMNGSKEILVPLRLRLRRLSLALAIFAVLGAGMVVSAGGTVTAPAKTERTTYGSGYNTHPVGALSVRAHPIQRS
jgi:hypothetical protein